MQALPMSRTTGVRVVLPFYAAGALFFLLMSVLLFTAAGQLQGHYFQPHLLAALHAGTIGWGTMIIFGASYQLLPVLCETDLFSAPLAIVSFFFLFTGVLLLVGSFWFFTTGYWMIGGAGLLLIACILFLINVAMTGGWHFRERIAKWFMAAASAWLLFTALLGCCMAVNLWHPFFSRSHLEWMKMHAHAGLAGWFLQMILGVSSKLLPMFLLSQSGRHKLMVWTWGLLNGGLLLYVLDGFFVGPGLHQLVYAGIVAAAIALFIVFIYPVYKNRLRRKLDWPMRQSMTSWIFLLLSLPWLLLTYLINGYQYAIGYMVFLLLGWISGLILGMTFKTLPFIVWNYHYKEVHGKEKLPMPRDLYSDRLLKLQYFSYLPSLLLISIALLLKIDWLINAALGIWLLAAVCYTLNAGKTICHKLKWPAHGNSNERSLV